ncbi:M24 family metallopeptidase [Pelagovum pacificum]|uniref:Aminopeptidase P family protein n=1 Tax=Pelagovum pacificum TaxID=2588711 RepID=A0A5C5GA46_9RHOB|nr:Xaa-Pro peptidase family protein [Pelagovum pacificum]QQA41562.1 aminopeptidase P family protein [Pelagovum pacificum]TNY30842.1 aminopeptidase P family protein [Pelagovum pacificum]
MNDRPTLFPVAEFHGRVEGLQRRLAQAGQDALLLTSAADIFYVTGFLTRFWESPARPWFLLVPAKGAPVAVIPAIGRDLMERTWITDIRMWDAPDPRDDGISLLADAISEHVPPDGLLGVPMGLETSLRMPLADYHRLLDRIAPRRPADATDIIQRVREVKSEAEVDRIRLTCAIASEAFDAVPAIVNRAPTLDAVFRGFQSALLDAGADWVSYTAGAAGAGGYGDVISPAGPQPLSPGDVLMLDTGAVRDGYFCDFDRNFSIGPVADETRQAHDALHAATDRLIDDLRPGMLACDAHRQLCAALELRGMRPGGGRLGHGLGVTLTEWPSFTDHDQTPLVAGMVLTIEPSVVLSSGRILVHEENVVLRPDGPELLSPRAPGEMVEIPL